MQLSEEQLHPSGQLHNTQNSSSTFKDANVVKPFSTENKPRLTRKQSEFVKEFTDPANKGLSTARIAQKAGYSGDMAALAVAGNRLLRNDNVQSHLAEHADLFESAITDTVRDWSKSDNSRRREIALDAAKFGHDKIFGRSAQKIDITEKKLIVNIDMTGQS